MATTLGRIHYTLDAEAAAASSDLVMEAIVENMDTKHRLFERLDKAAPRYVLTDSTSFPLPSVTLSPPPPLLALSLSPPPLLSQHHTVCQQHIVSAHHRDSQCD